MRKNAVIYARYSSSTQSEMSIEGQLKVCYDFAKREGYTIVREYIDRAKTGTDAEKRPQFQKMVHDSAKRQFEFTIVYQLDRFSRNKYDSATYKTKLKKNGVRVISAMENLSADASGVLMETLLEGMEEYYSLELSQKIKRGIAISVEKRRFIGGMVPIGFKLTEDKQYEIDPLTAPIVQTAFDMYASGHGLKEIATAITEQYGHKIGNPFNFVGKILDNVNYIGTYTRGGHIIEDAIPAIIDKNIFQRVKIMRDKKKRTPASGRAYSEYLLTTKLFCGHCSEMMTGTAGTSKTGKVHNYYGCKNSLYKKKAIKPCNKTNVKKNMIEDFIVTQAREQLTDKNIALIAKAVSEMVKKESNSHIIADLKRKLRENAKAVDNLMEAIEGGQHIDLLSDRITKKQEEKAELEKMLANEEMEKIELDENEIKFFLHHLQLGNIDDLEYRRALIAIFVNEIFLYDDGRVRIIFNASNRPVEIDCKLLNEIERLENGGILEGGEGSCMVGSSA